MKCMDLMEQKFENMEERPMETIRHLWNKKDKHRIGELTCKEFHKFLRALTGDRNLKAAASRRMFEGMDTKGIKAVTLSQMVHYMKEHKHTLWELLLEMAASYEIDDCAMTRYEQRALCQILGITLIAGDLANDES